jgi:hypothetical protein
MIISFGMGKLIGYWYSQHWPASNEGTNSSVEHSVNGES